MDKEFKQRFVVAMGKLAVLFEGELPQEKVELYYKYLSYFPIEKLENAIEYLIKNRKNHFFPLISEIIEAIEGNVELKASEAWCELIGNSFVNSDNLTIMTKKTCELAFGSLEDFYTADTKSESFDRTYFIKCYINLYNSSEEFDKYLANRKIKELNE
ncbi:hypothetical protein CMI37_30865 [Candidatus Pacearchaeota archaeon]|nr:hypothetical protein [Candidatus Pacearchaeota archaeon]